MLSKWGAIIMSNVTRYAAINTKIRALEKGLLNNEDYNQLVSKNSVSDVVEYLRDHTEYKSILKEKNITDLDIDKLEVLFKKYIVMHYEKLIHYFTNEYKKLFKILSMRYEIEDLKLYLRAISRKEDIGHIKELMIYAGIYSSLDHEALSSSDNLEELMENLKDTIYYDILRPYLAEDSEKRLFYMEMKLDGLYFKLLSDQGKKLDNEDRKIFTELLGKNIDLLNLQWIYRGLRFYKLSPEELINYTLHNGHYLNYKRIKELCYSDNESQLIEKMLDSRYGFLFDNKNTLEMFMERRIERYLYFLLLEYKRQQKLNIIESVVYIHLLEYEMRDVFSILEAIRYGLSEDDVKRFLVRKLQGEV